MTQVTPGETTNLIKQYSAKTIVSPKVQATLSSPRSKTDLGVKNDSVDLSKKASEFKKIYVDRKLGFVASVINSINNLTGLGKSSKKALKKIDDFESGKASKEETEKYLKEFKYTKKDSTEVVVDTLTGLASFAAYKNTKRLGIITDLFVQNKGIKRGAGIAGVILAGLTGMFTKPILKAINMIGVDKQTRKEERSRWRSWITGPIDGLLAPVAIAKGISVGIPAVLAANTVSRYTFNKKEYKSLKDYFNQQISGLGVKLLGAGAFIFAARKGDISLKSWEAATSKAVKNAEKLVDFDAIKRPSEFSELVEQIGLMRDGKIAQILGDKTLSIEQKMIELENYNIFLPKYLQTIPDNMMEACGLDELGKIVTKFKSDCPVTRTVSKAQAIVESAYGDKYKIIGNGPLGTGTVAETYLAKDTTLGKEVVIKMLKEGMSVEKIEADRKQIIELIKNSETTNHTQLEYFNKRVNVLFDAWAKEVDLKLEGEAAEILGKNAKNYSAIKPIEIKDNIYVMEKAPGIQFNKFVEYLQESKRRLSEKDFAQLMINYTQVFFEQLLSVPKKGSKVMHADPHPGNIFIDIDNPLKPFTFIDTGNVLRYTPKEAISNTINHIDYVIGNSSGIAKNMLRGAVLPDGMTEKQAINLLTKELNVKVYNKTTKLPINLFGDVNDFCMDVMQKNNIIANPNNTNLLKAEATYISNIVSLSDIDPYIDSSTMNSDQKEIVDKSKIILKEICESLYNSAINNKRHTFAELRSRINYISENKEQFLSTIYAPVSSMFK